MKDKIIKLRLEFLTYKEISEKLNCSSGSISYHCTKLKNNNEIRDIIELKNDDVLNLTIEEILNIKKLRNQKMVYDDIYDELNIPIHKISKVCKKLEMLNINNIDDDMVIKIKQSYKNIGSIRKVAKELNISRETVRKNITLPDDNLIKNKNKRIDSCKVTDWRRRNKIKLIEYKGSKCEICGYDKSVWSLGFHHKNPKEKSFSISSNSYSFEKNKIEVDKCVLICNNCHGELHEKLKYNL